jgi:hypothetical protein
MRWSVALLALVWIDGGVTHKAVAQQYIAATDRDLKAAYCLEVDKHFLAGLRQEFGNGASPKRPNGQHAIDVIQSLTDRVQTYVTTRLSESVDPAAISIAATRADADIKRLDTERPPDSETLNRHMACISWLPN